MNDDDEGDALVRGVKLAVLAVAAVVLAFVAGWRVTAKLVLLERTRR